MSPEAGESRRELGTRTLEIEVQIRPGSPNPVFVRPITLTNSVGKVVWRCADLPAGAGLRIVFPDDPRGPFFSLKAVSESEVVGLGNRGPEETGREYLYTVAIAGTDPELAGEVTMHNEATEAIPNGEPEKPWDPP